MRNKIAELLEKMQTLDGELEAELTRSRESARFAPKEGENRFEHETLQSHRNLRTGLFYYLRTTSLANYLTAPVIYALIVPLVLLDVMVSIYQWICFPVYGMPKVRRSQYVTLDRHRLAYLNGIEKLNCVYCGYFNGAIAYVREVAGRTEQYWCPIKHAEKVLGVHQRYYQFLEYGDAEGYRNRLEDIRNEVRAPDGRPPGDNL